MFSSLLKLFRQSYTYTTVDFSDKTLRVGQVSWTMVFPSENQAVAMAEQFLSLQHNKNICINAVMHGTSIDITVDYGANIDMNTVCDVMLDIIAAENKTRGE